jgi:chain length determinant protein (polysaccharide antigen chain regulator)
VRFADVQTVGQLYSDLRAAVQEEIDWIGQEMANKKEFATRRKLDQILRLKEAMQVAKKLDLKDVSLSSNGPREGEGGSAAAYTASMPLYMLGTKALKAEIELLETRKSEEPFIAGFRDLQEQKALLEGLKIDPDRLSAVTIDAAARIPYQVERPRKALIMALAVMLGAIGGIFIAFIAEFLSKAHKELLEASE